MKFLVNSKSGQAEVRCWCGAITAQDWETWSPEPLCADHLEEWRRQMSEDIYLRGERSQFAYLGGWRDVAPPYSTQAESAKLLEKYAPVVKAAVAMYDGSKGGIGDLKRAANKLIEDMLQYKTKSEMAYDLGSACGQGCWCGNVALTGYVHQKVWHPISCGSEACQALQAEFDSLPDNGNWESIFGR